MDRGSVLWGEGEVAADDDEAHDHGDDDDDDVEAYLKLDWGCVLWGRERL